MHLTAEQLITGPVFPASTDKAVAEIARRAESVTSLVGVVPLLVEQAKEQVVKAVTKPYSMLMAERTYPWIERDTLYGLQHRLQSFDICLPRPLEESPVGKTVWVLYVTARSFTYFVVSSPTFASMHCVAQNANSIEWRLTK